jgi:hypothetical protein
VCAAQSFGLFPTPDAELIFAIIMQTRLKAVCAGIVVALAAFVPSFKVFDWVLVAYWEWQHDKKMKITLWADDRALLLALLLCGVVFYVTVRYWQRHLPAEQRIKRRWLVVGALFAVIVVFLSIAAYVLAIVRQFSS